MATLLVVLRPQWFIREGDVKSSKKSQGGGRGLTTRCLLAQKEPDIARREQAICLSSKDLSRGRLWGLSVQAGNGKKMDNLGHAEGGDRSSWGLLMSQSHRKTVGCWVKTHLGACRHSAPPHLSSSRRAARSLRCYKARGWISHHQWLVGPSVLWDCRAAWDGRVKGGWGCPGSWLECEYVGPGDQCEISFMWTLWDGEWQELHVITGTALGDL